MGWFTSVGIMSALRRRAVEGGSYRVVVSLAGVTLWLLSLGIFDKKYAHATAGSSDEHTYVAPDLFTAETPLGLYQGITEQVVMSRTPGSFRTVLSSTWFFQSRMATTSPKMYKEILFVFNKCKNFENLGSVGRF